MTQAAEYTLNLPPPCPTNRDELARGGMPLKPPKLGKKPLEVESGKHSVVRPKSPGLWIRFIRLLYVLIRGDWGGPPSLKRKKRDRLSESDRPRTSRAQPENCTRAWTKATPTLSLSRLVSRF